MVDSLGLSGLLADEKNLLAFRVVSFSLFPLVISLRLLRKKGLPIDRRTLKQPFYAQCYVAAIFGLGIDLATIVDDLRWPFSKEGMVVTMLLAVCWYIFVQARWYARQLGTSFMPGLVQAMISFCVALVVLMIFAGAISSI